ncbi:hypothetical protein ACVGVM_25465 [Pseudonocardia bannensis]
MAVWLIASVVVAVFLSRVIRLRDRQVPLDRDRVPRPRPPHLSEADPESRDAAGAGRAGLDQPRRRGRG